MSIQQTKSGADVSVIVVPTHPELSDQSPLIPKCAFLLSDKSYIFLIMVRYSLEPTMEPLRSFRYGESFYFF